MLCVVWVWGGGGCAIHWGQGEAADALRSFYYPPVAAVTISYPVSALRPDRLTDGELNGFGQLHPRSQGIVTLGEYCVVTCFSDEP